MTLLQHVYMTLILFVMRPPVDYEKLLVYLLIKLIF